MQVAIGVHAIDQIADRFFVAYVDRTFRCPQRRERFVVLMHFGKMFGHQQTQNALPAVSWQPGAQNLRESDLESVVVCEYIELSGMVGSWSFMTLSRRTG